MSTTRRRVRRRRLILPLLMAVLGFGLGVAVGEAVHDNPQGGTQTIVRTLTPLGLAPAPITTTTP